MTQGHKLQHHLTLQELYEKLLVCLTWNLQQCTCVHVHEKSQQTYLLEVWPFNEDDLLKLNCMLSLSWILGNVWHCHFCTLFIATLSQHLTSLDKVWNQGTHIWVRKVGDNNLQWVEDHHCPIICTHEQLVYSYSVQKNCTCHPSHTYVLFCWGDF